MQAAVPVAQGAAPPGHPDPNNAFANAAPAPPPGGAQDIGEFGPYYIYQGQQLVEIPALNIVRDYDYAYKVTEEDLKDMISAGWCNSFESSALLATRPLKSRSIVVISDNGWMSGVKTVYTWCIRVDVKVDAVEGMRMGNLMLETESQDAEELLHYGRHVLWPVASDRAANARERWKLDETLKNSRLVEVYVPSDKPFSYTGIADYEFTNHTMPSTLRLLQAVVPKKHQKSHTFASNTPLPHFAWPVKEQPRHPIFASKIVSTGVAHRAARCMSFTASNTTTGWLALNLDLQEYIWKLLVDQCLLTSGGCESNSLSTWMTLRSVCRQSSGLVSRRTSKFMKTAVGLMLAARSMRVADSIPVRDFLVPRGINPQLLRLEIIYKEPPSESEEDAPYHVLWNDVYAYMRIRVGKPPNDAPPAPVSIRRATEKASRIVERGSQSRAAMRVPDPKPERSSMRIGLKRSTAAHGACSETAECLQYVPPVPFTAITLKLLCNVKLKLADPLKAAKLAKTKATGKESKAPMARVALNKPTVSRKRVEACQKNQVNWVMCANCEKWRTLPSGGDALSIHDIPKLWYCDMHPSGCADCSDPEDVADEGEVTTVYFGAIEEDDDDPEDSEAKRMRLSGGKAGKLRVNTRHTRSGIN